MGYHLWIEQYIQGKYQDCLEFLDAMVASSDEDTSMDDFNFL